METYCFYHRDLDGITSAAEVLHQYPEAKFIPVDYRDMYDQYDLSNARVIVVDFSFPDMSALQASCKELIWIDHHRTAYDMQRRAWKSTDIAGYRSLNFAGCMLTYAYFNKISLGDIRDSVIPPAIQYVNSYDLWQFTQGDDVDAFCATAYLEWEKPVDVPYDLFFNISMNVESCSVKGYIEKGILLLKAADKRVSYLANRDKIQQITTAQEVKINLLFTNATSDISKLGSYVNTERNCDIAAIYEIVDGNIRIHLRSRTCNVEPIAKALGGGGHPGAASYNTLDSVESARDKLCAAIFRIPNLKER